MNIQLTRTFVATLLFSFTTAAVNAQDSNVQIGLAEPIYGIKIKNNFPGATRGFARSFMLSNQDASVDFIGLGAYGSAINGVSTLVYGFIGPSYDKPMMTFMPNGNVGIGTTAPKAKLDITGGIAIQSLLSNTSLRPPVSSVKIPGEIRGYSNTSDQADDGFLRLSAGAGTNPVVLSYIDISSYSTLPDMNMNIVMGTNGLERIRIANSGNVGIGTSTPSEKLSVNGNIRAKEIKVENSNWPDYVFAKEYQLPSLEETEKHIKENGHLKGIPSAAEVKSNGIDLGVMNSKLLKSLEELTLQVIELNKTVKNQQSEINNLKKK